MRPLRRSHSHSQIPSYLFSLIPLSLFLLLAPSPTSAATSTVTVSAPVSSSTSYNSPSDFQDDILAAHNLYRDQHNASALAWNKSLADFGDKWAQGCVWKHSGGPNGENLAAGYTNATAAVDAWGNERAEYNFRKQGFSEQTGHFTQVVWKNTRTVGCGRVRCAGKDDTPGWYVVCEYHPRGNVADAYVQNVQAQINGAMGRRDTFSLEWIVVVGAGAWLIPVLAA